MHCRLCYSRVRIIRSSNSQMIVAPPGARKVYVTLLDVPFQFFYEDILFLDARQFIERRQRKHHFACRALLLRPIHEQNFRFVHQGRRIPLLKR